MFKKMSLGRRYFLYASLSILTGASAVSIGENRNFIYSQALDNSNKEFKVAGKNSLKARAAAKGLIYGAAAVKDYLVSNTNLKTSFVRECNMLVPDYQLKWDSIRPHPKKFDFTKSDWLAQFAQRHGMFFRGHTLVWHQALPVWFQEVANRKNAESLLLEHITTVTKHYGGKIHSWDVVNEAIEIDDGRTDGLRKTPWLEFLGADYIELAFRTAAACDPKAMLVYNDYGLEYDSYQDGAKRTAVLKLLERLKSRGTPIHALGIQSHLMGHIPGFNAKKLRGFLADVASLGLKILITELDVVDQELTSDPIARDRIIAGLYEDYLNIVLDERAVIAVLTWGLSDKYTWVSSFYPRSDKSPVRPLPLDSNMKYKLAWNAIARAFDHAPKR
ncbi:endo-1,4-beta-xylanase [Fischerella thermalis]|uniref:Beta-xylanase n=1 Tax=Fischerella thermalis CCMEE 5318 TaxID=2019666 RepID=A0A2N6L9M1_9CYAN|nr:endo-1,4-beta-xylanase [Fischerella thermalis]PMB19036.1 glycosyl hydrolase family 10 [Fischerella thermalis CCMEE 5318]